jgi:hypothetical protein
MHIFMKVVEDVSKVMLWCRHLPLRMLKKDLILKQRRCFLLKSPPKLLRQTSQ